MKKIIYSLFLIMCINGIHAQCLSSETEFKNYFDKNINSLDPIEGTWSISITCKKYADEKLVSSETSQNIGSLTIIKDGEKFIACDVKYKTNNMTFTKTAIDGIYISNLHVLKDGSNYTANATLTGGTLLEYSLDQNEDDIRNYYIDMAKEDGKEYSERDLKYIVAHTKLVDEYMWIKLSPSKNEYKSTKQSTGTGFAISSNGYIATCNHVIDGATSIKVKGIGGNFAKEYNAKVISADVNNDLAIIKIEDASFTTLGIIPYTIKATTSEVGSNIFLLGYPLTATMGDEIKLTDGIISAKSGYKGDITSYQISAAAQPGNSGGPLFDKTGNLIGVVNAKHVEAENATYAVKSSYLLNLIESLPITLTLQTVNILTWKTLPDQVKSIKNFVYIIEVN